MNRENLDGVGESISQSGGDGGSGDGSATMALFQIGIQAAGTLRAYAVAELGFGAGAQVGFDLVPVAPVVPDLFAGSADRQKAPQRLDLFQGLAQFGNQLLPLAFKQN